MKNTIAILILLLIPGFNFANDFGWIRILSTNTIIQTSFNQHGLTEHENFILKYNRMYYRYDLSTGVFENFYNGILDDTYYSGFINGNPFSRYHYINNFDISSLDTSFIVFTKNLYTPSTPNLSKIFITYNGGLNMIDTDYGLSGKKFRWLKISNENDSVFYVIVENKLYKSTNKGASIELVNELGGLYYNLHLYRYDNKILYSSNNFNTLLISTNNGSSFDSTTHSYFSKFVYNKHDSTLYGIAFNHIYRTIDGINWENYSTLQNITSLEFHHTIKSILYAGTPTGLFKSTDAGFTWELYNNSFSPFRKVINVYSHELLGDTVLVCTEFSVYKVYGTEIPSSFSLFQNFPNPFNPSTKLKFSLPSAQFTKLKIYNLLGQEVTTLVNQHLQLGSYEYTFDGSGLSSGVYFYRLEAGEFIQSKRMLLIK